MWVSERQLTSLIKTGMKRTERRNYKGEEGVMGILFTMGGSSERSMVKADRIMGGVKMIDPLSLYRPTKNSGKQRPWRTLNVANDRFGGYNQRQKPPGAHGEERRSAKK